MGNDKVNNVFIVLIKVLFTVIATIEKKLSGVSELCFYCDY